MFTGAELCNKLPPVRETQRISWVRIRKAMWVQVKPQGTLQAFLAYPLPVPIVMLLGWGTVLLSKVFSRAATPNSFRSRSSKADSRDRDWSVGSQGPCPWLWASWPGLCLSLLSTSAHINPRDTCQVQPKCCCFLKPSLILLEGTKTQPSLMWYVVLAIPILKAEAGGPRVQDQLGLFSKTSCQEKKYD